MRFRVFLLWVVFSSVFAPAAMAGNLDSPGLPSAGSGMYTLQGLYDYLLSGMTPTMSEAFLEPSAGPGSTGKTTKEIYDDISAAFVAAAAATPDKVMSGITFFSTDPANWGPIAGTLATQTPVSTSVNQPAGFYNAFDLSVVDANLASGNIRSGATIFSVPGSSTVLDTATVTGAGVGDILSGKTAFVNGTAVTGSVPAGNSVTGAAGSLTMTIPDGLYSGSKTATANDSNLATGNIKSGITIFGVGGKTEVVDTATATPAVATDIRSGKTAFVNGTTVNGSLPAQTLSNTSTTVNAGYYDATTLESVDADLSAGNIKAGVNVFGVSGTYPLAGVEKTGQTSCWDASGLLISCVGTGQDGEYQKGVAWPNPRFTDNSDGTATDNLTGLIWLKNGTCLSNSGGIDKTFGILNWVDALTWTNNLENGLCGLSDGSAAGDWRLPNRSELASLIDPKNYQPALPSGHPFAVDSSYDYWTSTTRAGIENNAWTVHTHYGYLFAYDKSNGFHVWPVRGGQ